MRIIFMGTPDFSVPVLEALVAAVQKIGGPVYCPPPPRPLPASRAERAPQPRWQACAARRGIGPLLVRPTPVSSVDKTLCAGLSILARLNAVLSAAILDAPTRGCLNIHASLLPRWRGAAPIHRAIMAGDARTGVCIMQMEAGLDTGPVLMRAETEIGSEETTAELHDRLSEMGAGLIVQALKQLDDLAPNPQPDIGVTYAQKIIKAEARIDWARSAVDIDRQIRGLSTFPGAWTEIAGQRVKLLGSRLASGAGNPGEVLDGTLTIACGDGAISLLRLQRAGKCAQDAETFLRGCPVPKGTQL
ncbi:UNVERIFIED_CONTAM: hypothetical protein GTU68_017871 [Idotea baltica]|nr:hypothetical protein [Idotea baltica]